MRKDIETEVAIIGAGIIGASVARELSKYKIDVVVIEKEADFCWSATKANGGLTRECFDPSFLFYGMMETFSSRNSDNVRLKNEVFAESLSITPYLFEELDVPLVTVGCLVIARNDRDLKVLESIQKNAEDAGIKANRMIDEKTAREMEPNLNKNLNILGVLESTEWSFCNSWRLCIALVENARENGVRIFLENEVLAIERENDTFLITTSKEKIRSRFIVNASGVNAGKIAAMVGANDFKIFPVRAQLCILDKAARGLVNHIIMAPGKLIDSNSIIPFISPTIEGNLELGFSCTQTNDASDISTTDEFNKIIFSLVKELIPLISEKDLIRSFSGIMAFENDQGFTEIIVRNSRYVPRFINIVVPFPGISLSPSVAKKSVEILAEQGLQLIENYSFNGRNKSIADFSNTISDEERDTMIVKNPSYSHVVCRCETVPEGEIIEAIIKGASTVDGVKFRVGAGMGRCQGSFCGPRILKILSRELNKPIEEITLKGEGSRILHYKKEEFLQKRYKNSC